MIKIMKYGEVPSGEIFARVTPTVDVASIVGEIIATVRAEGDKALLAYTEKFDKASLASLQVSEEEKQEALAKVDPDFLEIL
ncbi:MAG: histidinol dehydrogenase, partial [Clostridia bacterium]|nr:histidinol dehydrogenase [Clostridia bacterium]